MKIAVLTNDYPPNARGGAGVIAETQVKELQTRGHDVKVFFRPPTFLQKSIIARLFSHLFDLFEKNSLVLDILGWRPDVLITHNLTGCGIGTPGEIKLASIPWVHVLHDVQLVEPSGRIIAGEHFGFFRNVWRLGWAGMRRTFLGSPTVVISPTKWLLNFHRLYGLFVSTTSEIIPNPLVETASTAMPWMEREPSIVYVGRVDVDKGIDVLVRAWKSMGDSRPRLEIVGDGQRRFQLDAMNDGRLVIHGPVPHDRIRSIMSRARVVVVPSLVMENQPTVALEALASGCSVVASDVGGVAETIGDAGRIVKPGKVADLAAALQEALVTPPDEAKSQRVLAAHQLTTVVDELESVLTSNL